MLMSSISLSLHKMMLLLLPHGCLNSCLLVLKTPNQILFLNATVPRLALIFFPQTISQYNSTPTKISTSDFYFFNPSSAISQSWVYLLGYWCLLPYYIITYIGDFYNQNAYFPTEFSSFYCHFSLFTCANLSVTYDLWMSGLKGIPHFFFTNCCCIDCINCCSL